MRPPRDPIAAARRALELYPSTDNRTPVQIDLMQAFSRVRCGDLSEGIRHARSVYEVLGANERTTMVDSLAKQVVAIVPDEARDRPEVVAYRELLRPSQKAIEA